MPAAVPHRPRAAGSVGVPAERRRSAGEARRPAGEARRSAGNPWLVDLHELGRRAGSLQRLDRVLPAPACWRVEMIGVPEGAEVRLRLRLEAVMEGVLVSGEVEVPLTGSCARCLEDVDDVLRLDVQELFAYPGSTTEATSEEDEVRLVEADSVDLESMVRDAVVLALPLAPVCDEDCAGLCATCGQRLDDLPAGHGHDVVDPRWAGLAGRFTAPDTSGDHTTEEN